MTYVMNQTESNAQVKMSVLLVGETYFHIASCKVVMQSDETLQARHESLEPFSFE
jgi:hypothetical protein